MRNMLISLYSEDWLKVEKQVCETKEASKKECNKAEIKKCVRKPTVCCSAVFGKGN